MGRRGPTAPSDRPIRTGRTAWHRDPGAAIQAGADVPVLPGAWSGTPAAHIGHVADPGA